jgi:hypothetical protein
MATTHTEFGRFLNHYRALKKAGALQRIPVILSEGDSWFSTPLYNNMVDWLEVEANQAVFLRMESSGDLATRMFRGGNLTTIRRRVRDIAFDAVLISAGGNDFVDEFLSGLFKGAQPMTVQAALQSVVSSGRLDEVKAAYRKVLKLIDDERPGVPVIAHTYDWPRLLGVPAQLTVEQIGLVALFKRSIGDWIASPIKHVLPAQADQQAFARGMIEHFVSDVLDPLKTEFSSLSVVDLRGTLLADADWNDEMHPTAEGFRHLAIKLRAHLKTRLPAPKDSQI